LGQTNTNVSDHATAHYSNEEIGGGFRSLPVSAICYFSLATVLLVILQFDLLLTLRTEVNNHSHLQLSWYALPIAFCLPWFFGLRALRLTVAQKASPGLAPLSAARPIAESVCWSYLLLTLLVIHAFN